MPRVEEFDTFYTSTRRHLLHLTYALTGDRTTTAAAVTEAYRHAWRDWTRLRMADPVDYVRQEAGRSAAFLANTHPWRRRDGDGEADVDAELVKALAALTPNNRRLFVLQTLGELGLEAAARDVGLTDDAAIEGTQLAVAELEASLGTDLDTIEARLASLGRVTDRLSLPRPSVVRRESRRRTRRNTVAAVAATTAMVVAAGLIATESGPLSRAEAQPDREQIGSSAQAEEVAQRVLGADQDQLLDRDQISRLDPAKTWTVESTDASTTNTEPYATCAESRFADARLRAAYVRTYSASGGGNETAAEAIEVARSQGAAQKGYQTMVSWYSDCAVPRVQLTGSYTVDRPGLDVRILQLRTYADPNRTFTVGLSRSGVVTSSLVHEVDGDTGPDIQQFAQAVRDSMAMVCGSSGGDCGEGLTATRSVPPPTTDEPAFLGIVDLPPVASVDRPWVGTESAPLTDGQNPSATVCDNAAFSGSSVQEARSRTFVIPEEDRLPQQFGLSETIGRFDSPAAATRFTDTLADRIDACPDDNLSATISQDAEVEGDGITGRTWRVSFEVDADTTVYYRVGIVRRGTDVAQVSFSPTSAYDVGQDAFEALTVRAGERLAYVE
ncbi:hypothetical protein [Solicola sp. PLA-1-18]|uniref:hypothetical protein n=1 Tax=Solicola sp. PLA-1-18 TaxID=3380532 RepID=UPI003B7792D1